MTSPTEARVGDRYRSSRNRLTSLLGSIETADWETPVPACPGWRVRDVLAHLVGVIEDAAAGRISGPPDASQTADEVDRHRSDDPAELLGRWAMLAPPFESSISDGTRWPAFIDVLSHEHDIRGALGITGERDHPDLLRVAALLTNGLPDELEVVLDTEPDDGLDTGLEHEGDGTIRLHTTSFEFFRLRLGRRSRSQVAGLAWTADPTPWLDQLFVFGPAGADITE